MKEQVANFAFIGATIVVLPIVVLFWFVDRLIKVFIWVLQNQTVLEEKRQKPIPGGECETENKTWKINR